MMCKHCKASKEAELLAKIFESVPVKKVGWEEEAEKHRKLCTCKEQSDE